jgi:hypothetical protein
VDHAVVPRWTPLGTTTDSRRSAFYHLPGFLYARAVTNEGPSRRGVPLSQCFGFVGFSGRRSDQRHARVCAGWTRAKSRFFWPTTLRNLLWPGRRRNARKRRWSSRTCCLRPIRRNSGGYSGTYSLSSKHYSVTGTDPPPCSRSGQVDPAFLCGKTVSRIRIRRVYGSLGGFGCSRGFTAPSLLGPTPHSGFGGG